MKKIQNFFIIFLLAIFLSQPVLVFSQQQDDFQLWTTLGINARVPDSKFQLHWAAVNRFQNDASQFLIFFTFLGFTYQVWDWFNLGFFYRFQKVNGRSVQQVPYPEFNFTTSMGPIDFLNKNRFQTFISSTDTQFQYRNQVRFSHTFQRGQFSLTPFLSDEVFLGTNGSPVSQNRLAAGNGFGFLKGKLVFNLYYLFQIVKTPATIGFQRRHVLGTDLILNF